MYFKDFLIKIVMLIKRNQGFFGLNLIKNLCICLMKILNEVEYFINY